MRIGGQKIPIHTVLMVIFEALLITFSLLLAALALWMSRAAKVRWAQQALPQIEQLGNSDSPYFASGDDSLFRAYQLAEVAEQYIPRNSRLEKLRAAISSRRYHDRSAWR